MIARSLLIAVFVACSSFAAPRLVTGPEIDLGRADLAVPQPTYTRAAMATDGETIFVVHGSLYATLIDRAGRVLTPQPILLAPRTPVEAVSWYTDPHVLWYRGHYLVFFAASLNVHVLRVTPKGEVVERVTLPLTLGSWRTQFDVATDGTEIVVVHDGPKALRLGPDLQPLGTVDLFQPPYTSGAYARGIACGENRFAIVSVYRATVVVEFLAGGTLTAPVQVSDANIDDEYRTVARAAWTGSAFVTAWTECSDDDEDVCLGLWTPLTSGGEPAGPIRSLGYSRISASYAYSYDITLTVVDEQTVFFTWRDQEEQEIALGRRYRISGTPVGTAVNFGTGPLASLATRDGALAVFDSRRRLAWVESASSASLPADVPLVGTVAAPWAETLLVAAASSRQVAIVRRVYSGNVFDAELTVASHDGEVHETIPLGETVNAAVASDGQRFYLLTNRWLGPMTFSAAGSARSVELAPRGTPGGLVWTGEEFLAVWRQDSQLLLARLDRSGRLLELPASLGNSDPVSFLGRDGGALLATNDGSRISVTTLDAHGTPVGSPEVLQRLNPYGGFALGTDGETDAYAGVTSDFSDLVLAFRPRNGIFVATPTTPEPAPPSRLTNDSVAIAATRHGFVVAFLVYAPVLSSTHVALVDQQGQAIRTFVTPPGMGRARLLELTPDRLLFVYTRWVDDPKHVGQPRVFARTFSLLSSEGEGVFSVRPRRQ